MLGELFNPILEFLGLEWIGFIGVILLIFLIIWIIRG